MTPFIASSIFTLPTNLFAAIPILLSAIGLFLSLWVIIPTPTLFWLRFGVAVPELTPWLMGFNAIVLIVSHAILPAGWLDRIVLGCNLLSLLLSSLPPLQIPAANRRMATEMETNLGTDYLAKVPPETQQQMRPYPFVLADVFRGIAIAEVRIERGIVFAKPSGVELTLNVYRPLAIGKYPAVIIIYGGAWQSGNPSRNETFSQYLAAQGYSVIAIDYRHAPQHRFPAQWEDVQTALSYIKTHADDLEVDLTRIAVMGRSAGAQLAALLAYRSSPVPIRAIVNYYGPMNIAKSYYDPPVPNPINSQAILRSFIGGTPEEFPENYQKASPIHYIKPDLPPSLLVYAGRDHIVHSKYSRQLCEKLRMAGNQAIFLEIPWAEHIFDEVFQGIGNQLALYYTERFLAWALKSSDGEADSSLLQDRMETSQCQS